MVDFLNTISSFFQIPSSWLKFPDILIWAILPFFILTYFFKIFLYEKIRLFRNEFISWLLAILLGFLTTFVLRLGTIGVIIGMVGILWFKVNNIFLRIFLIIILLLILLNLNEIIRLIAKSI